LTDTYTDIYYTSPDGLRLYARDYGGAGERPTLLCMHGLTRNSADFHNLALHLKSRFRVISVDQRGRGRSDYDADKSRYRVDIYCADMFTLIEKLKLDNIVAVGTSMGGIMAMSMAFAKAKVFKAVILNDIGPEIDQAGLERIKGYVGASGPFADWPDAASAIKAQGPDVFPDYTDADWLAFAKRTCKKRADGQLEFAYDPAIGEPLQSDDSTAVPVDMWPLFMALFDAPLLVIRGQLSDILSAQTAEKMQLAHPDCQLAEIPRIGHAPMLDESESLNAIDAFLGCLS